MTGLEMTKLCAEAMGYTCAVMSQKYNGSAMICFVDEASLEFNPLIDDAQAMALVKKFEVDTCWCEDAWKATIYEGNIGKWETDNASLNRAIVECVAKMQADKPRDAAGDERSK